MEAKPFESLSSKLDISQYPKRLILIQEDYDGTLHALSTGTKDFTVKINQKVITATTFNDPEIETWSDWCHEALMKFWDENNKPS
jgi:hypothetical protein